MTSRSSPDAIDWLRRLVAHRTIVGKSNLALIDDVAQFLESHGATTSIIRGTRKGTANLYAVVGSSDSAAVILSAHTDVVDAPPEGWSSDPFELTRRGSRLHGRGTCDMKGFIATVLAAVPSLVARELRRPIGIALSADEEMGVRGVGPMLDVLAAAPIKPLFCVVGEPTRMRVAVAHKGKVALRISLRGRAAHSSAAPSGVNAIAYAARLVNELYALESELAEEARDERFAVPHASVNVGRIEGGSSVNVVASGCAFDVEFRLPPAQDPEHAQQAVEALVAHTRTSMRSRAPEADVAVEVLARYPGLDMDGETPALVAGLAGTDCGICVDFGTEAGLYRNRLGIPVVVCGPGDVAQAHTVDEFIEQDELVRCQRFLHQLADWISLA